MHPLLRRVYYYAKPWIPEQLRVGLRRIQAKRIVKNCAHVGPIRESAGRKPANWPGWPGGKQFAFVLTHDVESQKGVDRCLSVMQLEMHFGVRSSFNFIPEGGYSTPKELRSE